MDRLRRLLDWTLEDLPRLLPGWAIAVPALIFYPGVALLLPVTLGWTGTWLITTNEVGAMVALFLSLGWLFLQIEARDRRHLLEWTTDLRLLAADEFEWLVGELFRREGWSVEETGRQDGPDGNVDLRLTRGGERRLVQCKRWQSWHVGVTEVRAFGGTLAREQLPVTAGTFVTLSSLTAQARKEAKTLGLTVLEGPDLVSRIERVRRAEPCPLCQTPMRLERSARGWWLRCPRYPNCDGKRDLSADVARAVELLTRE